MTRRARRQISPERRGLYYGGMVLMAIGVVVFVSTFFTGPDTSMSHATFREGMDTTMATALTGMGLMVLGGILRTIGARGAAGSGMVLDPERARDDLEPWARMGGGMLKDAVDEANLGKPAAEPAVKVRCRACKTLNDEHARFCDQCGAEM